MSLKVDLDHVDWKVLNELRLDGRKTFKELGEAVGFTGLGAKKRVEKLLKQEVIRIAPLFNVEKLNIFLAMIFIEVESGEAMRKMIDRYKECPRVINFFTTMSGYNLIALVLAEDQGALESESIGKCSLRSNEGIRRSEFYPIGEVHYPLFLPLRAYTPGEMGDTTPCGIDCRECSPFQDRECVGCPAMSYYRGPLSGSGVRLRGF
jgi:DNA-binding Lrp family transcriptional regulator